MPSLASRCGLVVAVLVAGCGETVVVDETFEHVGAKQDAGPRLTISGTRTRETTGVFSETVTTAAPYQVGFGEQYDDGARPVFRVTALAVEQDGVTILDRAAGQTVVEGAPREGTDPARPAIVAYVPLPDLAFSVDSKVVVRATVEVDGEPSVVLEEAFVGTRDEKTYAGCDRVAMY
mgnify:CR=1 FL=1